MIAQINVTSKLIRKWEEARVYKFRYVCYLGYFLIFPFSTYFVYQNGGIRYESSVFMAIQLFFAFFSAMCYDICSSQLSYA